MANANGRSRFFGVVKELLRRRCLGFQGKPRPRWRGNYVLLITQYHVRCWVPGAGCWWKGCKSLENRAKERARVCLQVVLTHRGSRAPTQRLVRGRYRGMEIDRDILALAGFLAGNIASLRARRAQGTRG